MNTEDIWVSSISKKWLRYWNEKSSLIHEYQKADWGSETSMINVSKAVIGHLKLSDNIKILNAGCGTGKFEGLISEINPALEIYGFDIIEKLIRICNNKVIKNKSEFLMADTSRIPFKNNFFDAVISMGVLHCSDAPADKIIEELSRVTKIGGEIIITCANKEFDKNYPIDLRKDFTYFGSDFFIKNFKKNNIKLVKIGSVSTLTGNIGKINEYHNLFVKGVKVS